MFEVDLTKFFGTVLLLCVGFGIAQMAKWLVPAISSGNYELLLAISAIVLAVPATMLLGKGIRESSLFADSKNRPFSTSWPGKKAAAACWGPLSWP